MQINCIRGEVDVPKGSTTILNHVDGFRNLKESLHVGIKHSKIFYLGIHATQISNFLKSCDTHTLIWLTRIIRISYRT